MKMSKFIRIFCKKTVSYKYLDNIKICGSRVGMQAINGKLIIRLEWPYHCCMFLLELLMLIAVYLHLNQNTPGVKKVVAKN